MGRQDVRQKKWRDKMQDEKENRETRPGRKKWGDKMQDKKKWGYEMRDEKKMER